MPVRAALALCLGFLISAALPAVAQQSPDAHIVLDHPEAMTPAEAEAVYSELRQNMAALYAMAADYPAAATYQDWTRFNAAPYPSATHGNRYVNNYANALGRDYGALPAGGRYRAGAILAKDSISAIDDGSTYPGALFFMEKLADGTSPETADWRYVMVLPDGSVFGDSGGDNAEKVAYCHTCHELAADDDYVFFIPEEFRAK
jgi:hypothetical protein